MKILYSIQATGNGHISRAKEIVPYLKEYGEVNCMLSGDNSQLSTNDLPIKYRSKGLSFYYNSKGGIDYWKTILKFKPLRIYRDAKALPVEDYDIIINDFDFITSLSCRLKKVGSIGVGHQASFISENTPRWLKRSWIGEFILKNIGASTLYIGLHFREYDKFIYNPIIKKSILESTPILGKHILVYLPQYHDDLLIDIFRNIPKEKFFIFTKKARMTIDNVTLFSISNDKSLFDTFMVNSKAVITGAGFETPSEALYLGKKLMCIPIKGQYEQLCNAIALSKMGVTVELDITYPTFPEYLKEWIDEKINIKKKPYKLTTTTSQLVEIMVLKGRLAKEYIKISK